MPMGQNDKLCFALSEWHGQEKHAQTTGTTSKKQWQTTRKQTKWPQQKQTTSSETTIAAEIADAEIFTSTRPSQMFRN